MSRRKPALTPRAWRPPNEPTDVFERVRLLLPVARQCLADGIDPSRCEICDDYDEAAGHGFPEVADDEVSRAVHYLDAVYLLGITVGLSMQSAPVLERPHPTKRPSVTTRRPRNVPARRSSRAVFRR